MKNYRFIVPIALVLVFALSVYVLYDKKASVQREYDEQMELARYYRAQSIVVDAQMYYYKAIDINPSLATYLELGEMYEENEMTRAAMNLAEDLLEQFPEDAGAYEFAFRQYIKKGDYVECFSLADVVKKRGISSELVDAAIDAIEYQYYFVSKYENVGVFGGGMCPVQIKDRWGYVNMKGIQTVPARFVEVGPFFSDLAPVIDAQGGVYFIDAEGNQKRNVLNVDNIEKIGMIEKEVFRLYDGKEWGFYKLDGTRMCGGYADASNIGNGMAAVLTDDGWRLIDYNGKDYTGKSYQAVVMDDKEIVYRNGRVFVFDGSTYRMIDSSGKEYGQHSFEDARTFNDATYAAVKVNGKWGFVNKEGEMVIAPTYEDARSFSNGLAAVKIDGAWGFIDTNGELVINAIFCDAKDFTTKGTAYVNDGKYWRLLVLYKNNY